MVYLFSSTKDISKLDIDTGSVEYRSSFEMTYPQSSTKSIMMQAINEAGITH
nr:hypothetical protein [Bacillus pumilus]